MKLFRRSAAAAVFLLALAGLGAQAGTPNTASGGSVADRSVPFPLYKSPSVLSSDGSVPEYFMGNWIERTARRVLLDSGPFNIQLAPVETRWVFNSAFPYGPNLGLLWAGAGSNLYGTAGAVAQIGPVSIGFLPEFSYSQNADFELMEPIFAAGNEFVNPGHRSIDFPQRMGTEEFWDWSMGGSFVRLRFGKFSAGFSWEPIWLGPGFDNSLLVSSNAPGFPHADIGILPVETAIGAIEARLFGGVLEHSPYYAEYARPASQPEPSEQRYIAGMVFGYSPSFIPGMTVGFQRLFYSYLYGFPTIEQILAPVADVLFRSSLYSEDNPIGDDYMDQLLSVVLRWKFPQVGFETWAEYGKNDSAETLRDFLGSPDHARAFVLGVRQLFDLGGGWDCAVTAEMTELSRSHTRSIRPTPSWYPHGTIREGATNEGQIIGAWIGPGSNSQYLGAAFSGPGIRLNLFIRRVAWDLDTYYRIYDGVSNAFLHYDTRLHLGIDWEIAVGPACVGARMEHITNWNRYYLNPTESNELQGNPNDEENFHMQFYIRVR